MEFAGICAPVWIFGETLIPPKEKSYLEKSLNQIILGNYTDDVTELGTVGQILLGFTGLDVITDIRDLSHDMINWEWSWNHAGKTALDAIGLIPLIGSVKNADEAASIVNEVAKHGDEALDTGGKIVKHGDQLVEGAGSVNINKALETAQQAHKGGESLAGHALQKHAGRNPNIWGSVKGGSEQINQHAMKHIDDIIKGLGEFKIFTTDRGVQFWEKMLPDGRGLRLNLDGTFKGFIDQVR